VSRTLFLVFLSDDIKQTVSLWFRIIIKNLLLGYFHTPPSKRHEALQVIGHVLSYSRDEMKEVRLSTCAGFFEHILWIKFSELWSVVGLNHFVNMLYHLFVVKPLLLCLSMYYYYYYYTRLTVSFPGQPG